MRLLYAALLAPLLLALWAGAAHAKNLYVNNSGSPACSDSTTYAANDAANPWCLIGRAAWGSTSRASPNAGQAATAGDVVLITAGTYVTDGYTVGPPGCRDDVALQPANGGTSGNPITFRGVGVVNIRLGSGFYGPTIGTNGTNYITWDNVRIDETAAAGESCPDTGPVVLWGTTGSKIINSVIRGTNKTWGDNYNAIRMEAVSNCTIANNELYGFTGNWGRNMVGIMLYDTDNCVVEHNYIHGNQTGIFIKGDHTGFLQFNNTFRLNWIEDNGSAGIELSAAKGSLIYQNVIRNHTAWQIRGYADSTQNDDITISNNTLIGNDGASAGIGMYCSTPCALVFANLRVFNNIISGTFGEAVNNGPITSLGNSNWQHNLYFPSGAWGSINGSQISFATWQGTWAMDGVSPAGISGSNPSFVSTTYPGGYKLNGGSPAANLGVDILDLNNNASTTDNVNAGAYITGNEVIGPTAGGPPLLGPPTNVKGRPRPRKRRDWQRRHITRRAH
jgi:parallel beta-helix repeat protein